MDWRVACLAHPRAGLPHVPIRVFRPDAPGFVVPLLLSQTPFILQLSDRAKIDEQSKLVSRGLPFVMNLYSMLIDQLTDRFGRGWQAKGHHE